MKWLAIVNPVSGRKRTPAQIDRLTSTLKKLTPDCVLTQYPAHAALLAKNAAAYDGLAVAGGDGSVSQVLQGMDLGRQAVAVIPTGTGNSLARDLGLPHVAAAVDAVRDENLISIDLMQVSLKTSDGVVTPYTACSTMALGYPAHAARTGNQQLKALGRFCFPVASLVESFIQKEFLAMLDYGSGQIERRYLTGLIINNSRHMANFLAFPDASLQDGLFNVMELQAGFITQNLHNLSVLSKTYFYMPGRVAATSTLAIELDGPLDFMMDGEIFPLVTQIHIRSRPAALRCFRKGTAPL